MNKLTKEQIVKNIRQKLKEVDELLILLADEDLERRVAEELRNIGVSCNIKGYRYLIDAIVMAVENPESMYSITSILYPGVAEKNRTTDSRVERDIRHAIEKCFECSNQEKLYGIFKNTINPEKGKPTNSEFIARFVEYIKLNL